MHQLGGEPGRGPEPAEQLPRPGPVAGLLLELAARGEVRVLDRAVGPLVERAGRDLEQGAFGRAPVLADEQDVIVGIDGDDRHGTGMAGDVARGTRPVGPLDRVDPERQVTTAVEDPRVDDALDEIGPGFLRGRWLRASFGSRSGRAAAAARPPGRRVGGGAVGRQRLAGLAVEEVQLGERQRQLDDVAGPDAMLRSDDRHDVLVRGVDVEELLVAEVLDDVGAGLERRALAADLADLEVLGTEARDELLAGDVAGDAAQALGVGTAQSPGPTSRPCRPRRRR